MKTILFFSFVVIFFSTLIISDIVLSQDLKLNSPKNILKSNPFQIEDDFFTFNNHQLSSILDKKHSEKFIKKKADTLKVLYGFINVGAGLVNGGRIDFIFKFVNFLSAEISYGADVRNFISFSDEESRFTLGINWHNQKSFPFIISFLTTYAKSPLGNRSENPRYLFSINCGYLNMRAVGIKFLARLGFYAEFVRNNSYHEIRYGGFYPNIELGVGWVF